MSFSREPNAEPIRGYRLIEPLGSGGFGEVWKCEAPGGLFKAIKFVYGNLNSLDMEGARAEQELHSLQRVKEVRHPFILSTERIEIVEGELAIVMELADKSLHDLFVECQSAGLVGIPRDDLLRYLRDAAEALDHMNEKHNLQHLDIKPRNLFLVSDRVKVADFGLVKHLERHSASGVLGGVTPLYAPPETFSGKIAATTDQYSLGIVYQELLTGQRPFNGKNPRQLAQQHLQEEPELRPLPEAERPIVARALSKDPSRRFPNCLAFVRALYNARVALPPTKGRAAIKTMSDTLEDIFLGAVPDAGSPSTPEVEDEPAAEEPESSQVGMTVAQPQTGSLRPTLVIGIGSFGRRALMELRCRLLDRFGDLEKIPLFRFLYIDPDPEAVRSAVHAGGGDRNGLSAEAVTGQRSEVAFGPQEVHHLPLQAVSHYRRRQLDQLQEWLPREKLYSLPRSLKTLGSRALGRLAFTDNYLRLVTKLRHELQRALHPDSIYQSVSQTGLALRDNVPRLYVIASASGGASGFLPDLGYALRRLLNNCRVPEARLVSLLVCGAPDDPATPQPELANIYATLTEINHFADPASGFTAHYGADGPRLADQGPPFDCSYLVPLSNRTPEARREALAKLGSYLFHELTTPLGLRLDQVRGPSGVGPQQLSQDPNGITAFRSLGTYAVWFPRGLLLRLAARTSCIRLLEEWTATDGTGSGRAGAAGHGSGQHRRFALLPDQEVVARAPEVEAVCARALADPGLRPEALVARIEELAVAGLDGAPGEALARLLGGLEEQSQQFVALDDPGNWARQALSRVRDWLGTGLGQAGTTCSTGEWRKSKLSRALEAATAQAAEEWEQKLVEHAARLMEMPGRRVATAEAALGRFLAYCEEQSASGKERGVAQEKRVLEAQVQLQRALEQCVTGTGGFSFFGGRSRRLLRVFVDHLAAFARQCLAEDLNQAVQHFFTVLAGRLQERLRDLGFCRQRLRHLQDSLQNAGQSFDELADDGGHAGSEGNSTPSPLLSTESFWDALRQSATTRVVLPDGETDLERAAARFLHSLTPEHWTQLDQALQDRALAPRGGLHRICLGSNDLTRNLAVPLVEEVAGYLSEHLPVTDVAQVLMSGSGDVPVNAPRLEEQVQDYFTRAVPLLTGRPGKPSRRPGSRSDERKILDTSSPPPSPTEVPPGQHAFLLVPASEAGKAYGEQVQQVVRELQLVRVPGQAALLFCREQDYLSAEDLQRFLTPCRQAYEEAAASPLTSPHARHDITDWIPLDP